MESKVFFDIALKAKTSFKGSDAITDQYLKDFCIHAWRYTQGSPDLFRRALLFLVDNQNAYPAAADLKRAIEQLPKRPIDYAAANTLDAREKVGCGSCDHRGYFLCESPEGYSVAATCDACNGRHMTYALISLNEAKSKGYTTVKGRRRA